MIFNIIFTAIGVAIILLLIVIAMFLWRIDFDNDTFYKQNKSLSNSVSRIENHVRPDEDDSTIYIEKDS